MPGEIDEVPKVEPVDTPAAGTEVPAAVEAKPTSKMSKKELDTLLNGEPEDNSPDLADGLDEDDATKETPAAEDEITDDTDDSGTISSEDIKAILAENKRLLKKAENQDKFFDRVGTEVGLLRKRTPEEDKVELERIRDIYIDDPIEGHKAMEEYNANQEKATTVNREIEVNKRIEANRAGIEELLPDFETNQSEIVEELAALMTEDGAPPAAVKAFKAQPFLMDQATLYNLQLRNVAGKAITEKDTKIAELETEIEELKKRPDQLLSNIQNASKNNTLTGKSAGAVANSAANTSTQKPTSKMTNVELDKMLNG